MILDNGRVKVELSLDRGGVIRGIHLLDPPAIQQDALSLRDQLVLPGNHRLDWPGLQVVQRSATQVTLRGRLPRAAGLGADRLAREQGGFAYRSHIAAWPRTEDVLVEKTVALSPDSTRVVVHYRFTNTGEGDRSFCMLHAGALAEGRAARLSFHGWRGPQTWAVPMTDAAINAEPHLIGGQLSSVYDSAPAWLAWQGVDVPTVALWSAPAENSCLLVDPNGHGGIVRTEITLAPNATYETHLQILCVAPGPDVTHVERGVIASLTAPQAAPVAVSRQAKIEAAAPIAKADVLGGMDLSDLDAAVTQGQTPAVPPPVLVTMDLRFTDLSADTRPQTLRIGLRARGDAKDAWTWQEGHATLPATPTSRYRHAQAVQAPRPGAYQLRVQCGADWALHMPLQVQHFGGWLPAEPIQRQGQVYRGFRYPGLPRPSFEAEADWQPQLDVVTDHVALGKPLSGGPLRVLALVPYWQTRDVVGLAQRLDMDLTTLAIGRNGYRGKYTGYYDSTNATAPIDEQDRLRQLLAESYDAIVMLNVFGTWFSPELMDEVGRQVDEDGVGLLIVGEMDLFGRLESVAQAHSGAKGRVRHLAERYADATTPILRTEAQAQALCQELLQVAHSHTALLRRTPTVPETVAVAKLPLTIVLDRSAGKVQRVRVTVRRDLLTAWPFYGAVQLRDRETSTWETAVLSQDLDVAGQSAQFQIPDLPAGDYSVDLQYLDADGGVISWQRHPLTVTDPPATATAQATKAEAPATLLVHFKTSPLRETDRVRLTATDPSGRLLAMRVLQAPDLAQGLELPLPACRQPLVILQSLLLRDGHAIHDSRQLVSVSPIDRASAFDLRGYAEVTVNPSRHEYSTRVGGALASTAWLHIRKTDYGDWVPAAEFISTPGQLTPYPIAKLPTTDPLESVGKLDLTLEEPKPAGLDTPGAWVRSPCLNDPAWRGMQIARLTDYYRSMSQTEPYRGFAVDEWFYYKEPDGQAFRRDFVPVRHTNICRSPHCLAKFRTFAQDRFAGDLGRLNATWGTHFATWQEVVPPLIDPAQAAAPTEAQWPWILAHREFVDQQLPSLLADFRQAVKRVDPGCETGISGVWPTGIWNGLDIYQIAQHAHFNMIYSAPEMWTSFGAASVCRWGGYSQKYSPAISALTPWKTLFDGMDAYGYYGKQITPMFSADGVFMPGPAALFESVATMRRRGLDRLLVGQQTQDPVAVYYSPRDIYLASLREWQEAPDRYAETWRNAGRAHSELPRSSAAAAYDSLSQEQLQVRWLAAQQLQAGTLTTGDGAPLRLLYLPGAESLSDQQAQVLSAFVEAGGVLVADLRPGWRDEHGRRRDVGALDQLFGIQATIAAGSKTTGPATLRVEQDGAEVRMALTDAGSVPFTLEGAQAWAQIERVGDEPQPAFIVNSVGKGYAVLLNLVPTGLVATDMAGVEGEEQMDVAEPHEAASAMRRQLSRVWHLADLQLGAAVSPGVSLTRFQDNGSTILGLRTALADRERPIDLKLRDARHAYDSLRGLYLGYADHFSLQIDPSADAPVMIVGLSKTQVKPLTISPTATTVQAGDSLRLAATVGEIAVPMVVGFSVYGPDGHEQRLYRQATRGTSPVAFSLDLPLNAEPGTWRVVATHSLTGMEATAHITVAPRHD